MKTARYLFVTCLLALTALALMGCGTTTVNLNKYMKLSASGYDTAGTLDYSFDYAAFKEDYSKKISLNKKKDTSDLPVSGTDSATDAELMLWNCMDYQIDKSMHLSNGDTVTLTWMCNDELAKEFFGCRLKHEPIVFEVKDLEEVGQFNPFDYCTVSFTGVNGRGELVGDIKEDRPEFQGLYIAEDAAVFTDLSNGDKVTMHIKSSYTDEDFVELYGSVLSCREKTFVVSGLPDPVKLDAFEEGIFNVDSGEGVILEYSDISPNASVTITNNLPEDDPRSQLTYTAEPASGIEKGEKLVIRASLSDELYEEGYDLVAETTSVTADNVSVYISKAAQVAPNVDKEIRDEISDLVEAQFAPVKGMDCTDSSLVGYYVLTPKKTEGAYTQNQLWAIYKLNVHSAKGDKSEDMVLYEYLKFTNAILYSDGTGFVDVLTFDAPRKYSNGEYFSTKLATYIGFQTLDDLYNLHIASQKGTWIVDSSIEE